MYEKVSPNLNFVDREKQTVKFWKDNDIFKKSMENRKEGETYTFFFLLYRKLLSCKVKNALRGCTLRRIR